MAIISVVLALLQFWAVVAMPTCQLEGHLVHLAHDLLQKLGEDFPLRCQPYNTNMSFPESVLTATNNSFQQCPKALWVVSDSLERAAEIMEDTTPFGEGGKPWDRITFNGFQNIQYQIMDQGQCLTYNDASDTLASYFANVTAIIQQQDIASCGWMALRDDLLWVMKFTLHNYNACFTWRD